MPEVGTVTEQLDLTGGLIRTAALVHDVLAAASAEHGLTPQQSQLMCVVGDAPSSMVHLGAQLRIGKSSMTGLVHRAEQAGLVQRAPAPHDGRSTLITLTHEGRDANAAYRATVGARIAQIVSSLAPAERTVLEAALSKIVLSNHAPDTWPADEES